MSKAKDAKKDEFYTAYEDIQIEINHYEDIIVLEIIHITLELTEEF